MLPHGEPDLTAIATAKKGQPDGRTTAKNPYASANRPTWAGDTKLNLLRKAEDAGISFQSSAGVQHVMCFLCGKFSPINELSVEHCAPYDRIIAMLNDDAAAADRRALYPDGGVGYFMQETDESWHPTEWAGYAYSHDLANLMLAHRACNSSKGSTKDPATAIAGNQYSHLGRAYSALMTKGYRSVGLDHLITPQDGEDGRGFAMWPNEDTPEIGWADYFLVIYSNSPNMPTLLEGAQELQEQTVRIEHDVLRQILGTLPLDEGEGPNPILTKTKVLRPAQEDARGHLAAAAAVPFMHRDAPEPRDDGRWRDRERQLERQRERAWDRMEPADRDRAERRGAGAGASSREDAALDFRGRSPERRPANEAAKRKRSRSRERSQSRSPVRDGSPG